MVLKKKWPCFTADRLSCGLFGSLQWQPGTGAGRGRSGSAERA